MNKFTNQASISYNGVVSNSNIVTGQITQIITVWKNATVDEYRHNEILTYVVSIKNSGTTDYEGIDLSDNLGAYTDAEGYVAPLTYTGDPVLYYINGILQPSPSVTAGRSLVIRDIEVPACCSSIIIYRVAVNEYAPLGESGKITNTVTLSGGCLSESISASETVNANTDVSLSILKALNPTTVIENGQVTYTFTIQNTGATASVADPFKGVVVNDTFNPPLSANPTVTLNGVVWPASNYSYNHTTGVFRTKAGQLTVPAATYARNPATGLWSTTPGVTTLEITGTIL